MKPRPAQSATEAWDWLQTNPKLTELCAAYPQDWQTVQATLADVFSRRDAAELKALAEQTARKARPSQGFLSGERDGRAFEALLHQQVRQRMTDLAIRQYAFSAATGVRQGKVRFNWLNGFIAQKLLFSHDLVRKPVSMFWFKLWWPMLWQKRRLMPLVEKRGIYCFYSQPLISQLAARIGGRKCIEIAAGDGTLTAFLRHQGVNIDASDDASWAGAVNYPDWVRRMDAIEALKTQSPEVVICSWPPANNRFERQVFRTRSVQTYIVIASRSQFLTGNWADYRAQNTFTLHEDASLSRLVLPPELGAAVYVFERCS